MEQILSIETWWKQQEQTQVEIQRLRAVLEQYADLDNWNFDGARWWWPPCRLGPGPAQEALRVQPEAGGEPEKG